MKNKDEFPVTNEPMEIFLVTMDVIDECLSEAIEREDFEKSEYAYHIN
jgi:hypothetical protein